MSFKNMNLQKTTNDISSLVTLVRSKPFPTYPEYTTLHPD